MGCPDRIHLPVFADDILQALPVHVFHHKKMCIAVLVDVVRANDIRMIELRGRPSFAVKSLERGWIVLQLVGRQNLQGDMPVHENVFAQVHRAHSAGADRFQELVFAAEPKSPPFAGEDLLRLEDGEQSVADHPFRDVFRLIEGGAGIAE